MLALFLLALIPLIMWLGQSALLLRAGLPLRLRISAADLPRPLKRINRAVTYVAFAAVLLGYPWLRGRTPLAYYSDFFPLGYRAFEMLYGAAAAILYLALLYLAWNLTDNVRFRVRHSPGRLIQRLAGVPPTALLVAVLEELLFRAILLAGLIESFPARIALPLGVLAFAGAHYVRSVKRHWTFPGHLALGTLFCAAFFWSDALWLSVGLHAGGVLVLMAVRPFVRYTGPAWLVGASIFPYAGAVGILALLLLTVNMWLTWFSYSGGI
jgi:membrane protease YdiL (CAAX protease family)